MPRRRIPPAEYRAQFPDVLDAGFRDAISVPEAAEIMGCTHTHVHNLVKRGQLAGKLLTQQSMIVSKKAAEANVREARRRKGETGRPRSRLDT